jgi:mono/diheme cytochrome c family protein
MLAVLFAWAVVHAKGPQVSSTRAAPPETKAAAAASPRAILDTYCVTCHNQRLKTADLALDTLDLAQVANHAGVWERVVRKVRVGMMPPQGVPRPDAGQQRALVAWLESSLDRAAASRPDPGRSTIHRLNRAEYAAAIRDLLALDVDSSALLPPDDSGYGFDNIADVLGVSPVLMERYLTAASKIAALAVGDPDTQPAGETFMVRQDASQDQQIDGLPIGTVGGRLIETTLPLDGEYVIQVKLFRTNLGAMRGLESEHQLEIAVDGERVHVASFGGDDDFKAALANPTAAGDAVEARFTVRKPLPAGPTKIGVTFLRNVAPVPWRLQPFLRSSNDTLDPAGWPHIDRVIVTGPFNPTGPGDTPSRRRIFTCRPRGSNGVSGFPGPSRVEGSRTSEDACAKQIIATLARRAYRGHVTDADLTRLFEFYAEGRSGRTFDAGIQLALQRILASPKFTFRIERDPAGIAPGTAYRLADLELASRLSFFLWSSIPDDELLDLASRGRLRNPDVLAKQVSRMLADPKSRALVENFAGQWLYLRNLRNQVPNSLAFPDFDDNLRRAFETETELFFESVMREDRNVLDLMTADYTFLNERLARHYDVPNVMGSHFRRVKMTDTNRRGLLGHGSVLMVSSHTDRTSPVVRGKWILDNLMGAPPPPPPVNVPPLKESEGPGTKVQTLRERLEEHRGNPTCAACHKLMDPIGFALENFDAVGAYRTRDGGTLGPVIDASGQLMDGTRVDGVATLREALVRQPEIFVGTFTEKLMTYALGRGVGASDMPVVRAILRDTARQNYRFSTIVQGIVASAPFQMRTSAPTSASPESTTARR